VVHAFQTIRRLFSTMHTGTDYELPRGDSNADLLKLLGIVNVIGTLRVPLSRTAHGVCLLHYPPENLGVPRVLKLSLQITSDDWLRGSR